MTETKPYEGHTPLPWVADLGETYSIRAADGRVAYCQHVHLTGRRDPSTVAANAALIVHRVNKGPAADAMASAAERAIEIIERNLYHQREKVEDAKLVLRTALAAYREKSE